MTSLESEVLAALRPGGMLTLSAIAKATGKPKWLVRRAANSLRRQSLAWENKRSQWQAYLTGRS
jgi:DNA-binding IclR family transcriptional regulator